ncbi:class I adenylate-forming enzyme family protein [Pusillimonas sp. SM2304]|uniref:class I adenylate-forming enzyme family protein n=1 Tax=Pusillimonas sp. SM2304 TaxID=3073241 RepID=UPI0028770D6F|nr:class I adenylate-forming enzyme family protein [Pusillimonas sp. SM2304]MDS1140233.1 class I adenylate-forming enzyme family protein [Pusillimonas sp. SM2304]
MAHADRLSAQQPQRLSDIVRFWAARSPQAVALSQAGAVFSYGQLAQAMDAAADVLRASGVRPGDRVMMVAENSIALMVLILAAARLDAWAVNVNARLSAAEIQAIRQHSQPRRVMYTVGVSPEAGAHALHQGAMPLELPGVGQVAMGPLDEACQPEPVYADGRDQVAALIYTTGTTGQPKGVMLTHRNLLFVAASSSQVRGLVPEDRAYGVLPITHVFGLASVAFGTLYAGASLYLAARYAPADLIDTLRRERLTIFQGVPAMYARLLEYDYGDWNPAGSSLRFIYAGGSPLDATLKAQVERLFGRVLHNGYGLTESSPTISQTRIDAPRSDTSVGQVIPGVEIRIVGSDGRDVPEGEPGELWARGPNVMKGYYREPALTAGAIDEAGWLRTGDLVRREADGALFLVGRSKELIIRSGFNVYPIEVEAALNAHPAVVQSAVVGRQTADGNEEVVAFVELDPAMGDVDLAELQTWLGPRLSPYKRPSRIVAMPAMPAAATGKILKGRLKQLAQQLH